MSAETFEALYRRLLEGALGPEPGREASPDFDPHQLDCLLRPDRHPPVIRLGQCACSPDRRAACAGTCLFDALTHDEQGQAVIDPALCTGCEQCVKGCPARNLTASKDVVAMVEAMKEGDRPFYALIAPAYISQFTQEVTPGRLRSAFKALGFAGMVEVALYADMLTLKEALEFEQMVTTEEDFLLTSCCCPLWIAMIRRIYGQLVPRVPPSVSPMVACGRAVKALVPQAVTVFVGPCVAKKAEAREADIKDAVDFVLTFQEVRDLFAFAAVDPAALEEDLRDHSSRAGRIYAKTGGVSRAVEDTVERLFPGRSPAVRARQADGVPACRAMLKEVMAGDIGANFLEGMGCVGGCVGGPKALIDREEGARHVEHYGGQAAQTTPIDNPYVVEMLKRLNLSAPEDLLNPDGIFNRKL